MQILCIASGESLTQNDVDYCTGKVLTYVVNDVYKVAPWADLLYAADGDWWDYHEGAKDFKGEKWTCDYSASQKWGLSYIPYNAQAIWSHDKNVIATGGNSGFQCINLADLHGANEIILLGYDYGFTDKKHFFGEHPSRINRGSNYAEWYKRLKSAKPFINANVVNCTRKSTIDFFETRYLRDVL